MVAIIQLKKYIAGARILNIIIIELSHWQKPYLAILFKVDKGLEISFHCTILSFDLAVYLKIEGSWKPPFDAKEVTEQ